MRANRFQLIIRDTTAADEAREVLAQLDRVGVPNYYGEQRFGIGERNIVRARAMLLGEQPAPRDPFERKLLMSAFQSALFNAWLAARIRDDLYTVPIAGDVMRKEDSGGLFINHDERDATQRMLAWEISPTGPMFGAKMRSAEGSAAERELAILAASEVTADALQRFAKAGEGTRRSARIRPIGCEVERLADALQLRFELPSGAYATTVLREIMKLEPDTDSARPGKSPA